MPSFDPPRAFEECARQIWHFELANISPNHTDDIRQERRKLLVALQEAAPPALQFGVKRGFPDFNELEKRILAVQSTCQALQRRQMNWFPGPRDPIMLPGEPPCDM